MGTSIGVEVALPAVDPARMAALVDASWRHRAPRRLLKELDAGG